MLRFEKFSEGSRSRAFMQVKGGWNLTSESTKTLLSVVIEQLVTSSFIIQYKMLPGTSFCGRAYRCHDRCVEFQNPGIV